MTKTWILVADSSRARIFSKNGTATIVEEEGLIHPESRMHEQDLTSDVPGRDSGRVGSERHGVSPRVSQKKHEIIIFSKQVADHLEEGRTKGHFGKLYLVASPSFLGLLRTHMGAALTATVAGEVNKNLVQLRMEEIRAHLPQRL